MPAEPTSITLTAPPVLVLQAPGPQGPQGVPGSSTNTVPSYSTAGLPASPTRGSVAAVTDQTEGLYYVPQGTGLWEAVVKGRTDIRYYGARPTQGPGLLNTPLQNWNLLQPLLSAGGVSWYVPPGTWEARNASNSSLNVGAANVDIEGAGAQSVLANLATNPANGDGYTALSCGVATTPISNIRIANLTVQSAGTTYNPANIGTPCLYMALTGCSVSLLLVDNVNCISPFRGGISNGGLLDRFTVMRCNIVACGEEPIYLAGVPTNGKVLYNRITGQINRTSAGKPCAGMNIKNALHLELVGNYISDSTLAAIQLANDFPNSFVTIRGGWLLNGAGAGTRALTIYGSDILIDGVIIDNFPTDAILLAQLDSAPQTRNTVRNCTISNVNGYAVNAAPSAGSTTAPANVVIQNNCGYNNVSPVHAAATRGLSRILGNGHQRDVANTGGWFLGAPGTGSQLLFDDNTTLGHGAVANNPTQVPPSSSIAAGVVQGTNRWY